MTTRLGISITRAECAAVIVQRGGVRWRGRVVRGQGQGVRAAVAELVSAAPKRRSGIRVVVALGVSYAQIKKIGGLPSTMRADLASTLVRENVAAFFLRSSPRLVVTKVQRGDDGSAWSAALDGTLVDDAIDGLRENGLRAVAFVPEPVAMLAALPPGSHRVVDGDVVAEFTIADARTIRQFRRARAEATSEPSEMPEDLPTAIRSIGADACHYAAAFAAANCSPNHSLAWRPPADPRKARSLARLRLVASAATFTLSIVAALLAPGIRGSLDARRAMRLAEQRGEIRAAATSVEGNLRSITASLDQVDRFVARRGDVPLVLAELARVLPESTAVLGVHVDSVEVSLSILTPNAADAVTELTHAERVTSPRILGSVMRDAGKHASLERATIRLRRLSPHQRPRR